MHDTESMTACPNEVEEIIRVSHEQLLDSNRKKTEEWTLRNQIYKVPYYQVHRVPLWGATAMILQNGYAFIKA